MQRVNWLLGNLARSSNVVAGSCVSDPCFTNQCCEAVTRSPRSRQVLSSEEEEEESLSTSFPMTPRNELKYSDIHYRFIKIHVNCVTHIFYYTICGRDLQRIQSTTKRISWTPEQLRWKLLEAWRWIKRWDRPPLCKPLLRLKKKRLSIEESIQGLLQDQAEVPHMRYSVWCFPSLKSIVIGNTLMISKSYALALKYQAEVPF